MTTPVKFAIAPKSVTLERFRKVFREPRLWLKIHLLPYFVFCICLPPLALFFCATYASTVHIEQLHTFSKCHEKSLIVSLTRATGIYQPQRAVWMFATSIHFTPRFLAVFAYFVMYRDAVRLIPEFAGKWPRGHLAGIFIMSLLYGVELTTVLTVAFFGVRESFDVHRKSFYYYIYSTFIYMAINLYYHGRLARTMNNSWIARWDTTPGNLRTSLKWKRRAFWWFVSSLFICYSFFIAHSRLCVPYSYTMFALMEYVTIGGNVMFHWCGYWDFSVQRLCVKIRQRQPTQNYCRVNSETGSVTLFHDQPF